MFRSAAYPLPVLNSIHAMNDTAKLSYPGSRRVYIPGRLHPDVQVPMREVVLSDTLLPDGTTHPRLLPSRTNPNRDTSPNSFPRNCS